MEREIKLVYFVDDLIKGMIKLMNSDICTPVNIGNPHEFTILELAEKIKKLINPNLNFIYKSLPEDDPLQRKPDISKAIKNLNWHPEISLDEGINLTIDWFKKEYFK